MINEDFIIYIKALNVDMIVAHGNNFAIGANNRLPWKCPADMNFFIKTSKAYRHLLVGRVTANGLPLLEGRVLYTLSRQGNADFSSIKEVIEFDRDVPLLVCGGAEVYRACLPHITTLYVTTLYIDVPNADTYFPSEYVRNFRQVEIIKEGLSNGINYTIKKMVRV